MQSNNPEFEPNDDALLMALFETEPSLAIKGQPNLFLVAMADAFAAVEKHDTRVTYVYMNPDDFEQGRASLTEDLDRDQLSSNLVLWGAPVITMATFPRGWGLLGCSPPVGLTPEELMAVHRDAVFTLPELPSK